MYSHYLHISHSSYINLLRAEACLVLGPCQTKIRYLCSAVLADEHVSGFQISVDDIQAMEVYLAGRVQGCIDTVCYFGDGDMLTNALMMSSAANRACLRFIAGTDPLVVSD